MQQYIVTGNWKISTNNRKQFVLINCAQVTNFLYIKVHISAFLCSISFLHILLINAATNSDFLRRDAFIYPLISILCLNLLSIYILKTFPFFFWKQIKLNIETIFHFYKRQNNKPYQQRRRIVWVWFNMNCTSNLI